MTNALLEVYISRAGSPTDDLALDAWLLERAAEGVCCAAISSWPQPVVVLGYGQSTDDVDLEWCRAAGIPVLRRITGGTGVVHRGDLALSLALTKDHPWARGIVSLYGRFLDALVPALRAAGADVSRLQSPQRATRVRSPICFEDQLSDTLVQDGRKVVGCAQARRARAVLIHAAILLGLDAGLYARVFRVDEERVRGGLAAAVPGASWDELGLAAVQGLASSLGLVVAMRPLPELPDHLRTRYQESRWAPVPAH